MTIEIPIFVCAGLSALAIPSIVLLFAMPAIWAAGNRRYDAAMDRFQMERQCWESRDRDAWGCVDELTREVAELRGVLNVRRVKRKA